MANQNLINLDRALLNKDFKSFGDILENEALTLHALMLSSSPSFILLEERSLLIIKRIREFRQKTGEHLYFTIDAGPNIHMIYESSELILNFLKDEISPICDKLIYDRKGDGPSVLEETYE